MQRRRFIIRRIRKFAHMRQAAGLRSLRRRMEEVRAARQQKLDERQKAWEAEQAKKAAAEQLREAKAAGPNGSSSSSSSANTPEPPAGVTTTRQVYNGGTSGRNASGGRIFNAR